MEEERNEEATLGRSKDSSEGEEVDDERRQLKGKKASSPPLSFQKKRNFDALALPRYRLSFHLPNARGSRHRARAARRRGSDGGVPAAAAREAAHRCRHGGKTILVFFLLLTGLLTNEDELLFPLFLRSTDVTPPLDG